MKKEVTAQDSRSDQESSTLMDIGSIRAQPVPGHGRRNIQKMGSVGHLRCQRPRMSAIKKGKRAMRTDEFVRILLAQRISITYGYNIRRCPWFEYEEYAELTSLLDFGCSFKGDACAENGLNLQRLKYYKHKRRTATSAADKEFFSDTITKLYMAASCCLSCRSAVGHFNNVNGDTLTLLAEKFDAKSGFWRKGRGCLLPRKLRSTTCLTHYCRRVVDKYWIDILADILNTRWPRNDYPEFIEIRRFHSSPTRRRRKRWIPAYALREMILKAKNKPRKVKT